MPFLRGVRVLSTYAGDRPSAIDEPLRRKSANPRLSTAPGPRRHRSHRLVGLCQPTKGADSSLHKYVYDREPLLDVTQPGEHWPRQDFLISSDVFEHVRPPVSLAFAGARRLLKPDGVLILSVPFIRRPIDTIEHFPTLHDYVILEECGQMVLRNRRPDGTIEVFDQLIFHGGEGTTLEFRLFSEWSLCRELHNAGFRRVDVFRRTVPEWGIYWLEPWSVPLLARP